MKKIIIGLSVITIVLTLVLLIQAMRITISLEQKQRFCSPPEFNYDFYDGYCLSVYKRQYLLFEEYEIFITKKGVETYGFGIKSPLGDNLVNVNWTIDGVEISQASKEEIVIFIPKENFIGGR